MSLAPLLAGLLLSAAASAQEPAPEAELKLEADRIVVGAEGVSGEGSVRAVLQGGTLEAERFEVALDGSGAVLEDGLWRHPDGQLAFGRLEILEDGTVRMDGAELSLCACEGDRQLWSVQARRVRVERERSAVFVGGLLRIGGCPVLPIPAGIFPLGERRSGLLAPRFSSTPDGVEIGQPVYLTLGRSADLTLEPTWRQERGFRLGSELRWVQPRSGGGELDAAVGWDAVTGSTRGVVDVEQGYVDRAFRSAVSGSAVSDLDYRSDYELDFTRRQQGFHELRGLVGLGPVRLEHGSFQAEESMPQRLMGLVISRPARDAGPLSPEAWFDLELGGRGDSALRTTDPWLRAISGIGLNAARPVGPVEAELRLLGQGGVYVPAGDPLLVGMTPDGALLEGGASVELRAALPLWADHGRFRHILRPGLVAGSGVSGAQEGLEGWATPLESTPLWWVGPGVQSRWIGRAGVPVHAQAALPWSDEGLAPSATARWSEGPWWGQLQGSARWQPGDAPSDAFAWLEAGRRTEVLTVAAGVVAIQEASAADQLSARLAWQLPWGADRWEPRARARWSLDDAAFVEQHLGLYFASRCRCLGIEAGASWAEDRDLPTFGMRVDLGR